MRHSIAIAIKFALTAVSLYFVLGLFYGVPFIHILSMSILLTAIGYLTDFFILPRVGNLSALFTDMGVSFAIIASYLLYFLSVHFPVTTSSIYATIVISAGEWFFHRYMRKTMFRDQPEAIK